MNKLTVNVDELLKQINNEDELELVYILKAWEKLSSQNKVEEDLSFNSFYISKITLNRLSSIFNQLSQYFLIFETGKKNLSSISEPDLIKLLRMVKNVTKFPQVNDAFYVERSKRNGKKGSLIIPPQLVELGINLLNNNFEELYVPFTNGFTYSNYTEKRIYADYYYHIVSTYVELIRILEDKDITFHGVNALENPTFINSEAPHLLKEFDAVLSFPPLGFKGNIDLSNDHFQRFNYQKGLVYDVAHFEHILAQTKSKAVVLMPVGFTYRNGGEEDFRKHLIDKNLLEAIIQLPPNLLNATSVETTFFVINKHKDNEKIHFINLKDNHFLTREGRKLIFKSITEILTIYTKREEIDSISAIVHNNDVANNNYSLAIDRYVVSHDAKELQSALKQFSLVELQKIADIKKSQLLKDEGEGLEIFEISPTNFKKAGFTLELGKKKKIGLQEKRFKTYKLEPYDVLLSTKGTIGKVAIIGEVNDPMIASQAVQVIRLHCSEKKEKAIALYMFFKSELGQTILSSIVSGMAMPQISTLEIKQLEVPSFTKAQNDELLLNFNNEIEMYNKLFLLEQKIQELHQNFLSS